MLSEALADKFDRVFRLVNERGVPRVYKYGTTMLDISASFLVCKIKEVSNDVLNIVSNVAPLHDALVSSAPRSDKWLAVILKTTKLLDDEMDNKRFLRLPLFAACTAMFDAAYAEYPTDFFQQHTARLFAVTPRSVRRPGAIPCPRNPYLNLGATCDSKGSNDKSTVRVKFVEVRAGKRHINDSFDMEEADKYVAHLTKTADLQQALELAADRYKEIRMSMAKRNYQLMLSTKRSHGMGWASSGPRPFNHTVFEYVDCSTFPSKSMTLGARCDKYDKLVLYVRYLSADPAERALELAAQNDWFDPASLSNIKVVANDLKFDLPMPMQTGDEESLASFFFAELDAKQTASVKLFGNYKKYKPSKVLAPVKAVEAFKKKTRDMASFIMNKINEKHNDVWGKKLNTVVTGIRKGVHVTC
jgi:hypothetical protein